MAEKVLAPLTPNALAALEILKVATSPITLAEMKVSNSAIAASQLNALVTRGYAVAEKVEFVCPACGRKSVKNIYTVTDAGKAFAQ